MYAYNDKIIQIFIEYLLNDKKSRFMLFDGKNWSH